MNAIMGIHIAAGFIALVTGAMAVSSRKGGPAHASAGIWFGGSMLVLGATASILGPFKVPPDSVVGGLLVCYFVATSWMTARRRDGKAGLFEKVACVAVTLCAAATIGEGVAAMSAPPGEIPGPAALFAFAGICLLAGFGDLIFILRGRLSAKQRMSRHLWRMLLAFFIATGSFFIGQQDIMPEFMRGSPFLFVLGFSPFAIMAYWLVRLRFPKAIGKLTLRKPLAAAAGARASSTARLETEM
jgi:hypothetical protein